MRVAFSAEAAADLEDIADHIAADSPIRAQSFVRELVASARSLGDLPRGFPLVPRYAHLGIRRRVHGVYLIFYRVDAGQVVVIHIAHDALDYDTLLFPQD